MRKNIHTIALKAIITSLMVLAGAAFFATTVSARAPSLMLSNTGYGAVQATVYADANAPIVLNYYTGYQLQGAGVIGYTDWNGYFSSQLGNQYGIPYGAQVMVVVNGQQSQPIVWPIATAYPYNNAYNSAYTNYNYNYPNYSTDYSNPQQYYGNGNSTLNQTYITLNVGETRTVYLNSYTGYSTNYYNDNQYYITNGGGNITSASLADNSVDIRGVNTGSTTINICPRSYNSGACMTIYVTVNDSRNYSSGHYYDQNYTNTNYWRDRNHQ